MAAALFAESLKCDDLSRAVLIMVEEAAPESPGLEP
jgi:hypothetical protein